MIFENRDRQTIINEAIEGMGEEDLRNVLKNLLRSPDPGESDDSLKNMINILQQTGSDFEFQEAALAAKKSIDASYMPYSSYYKDRLITLILDASRDAGAPEEGICFKNLAEDLEVSFFRFWDGYTSVGDFDKKRFRMLSVLWRVVELVVHRCGVNYFSKNQRDVLSCMLGESSLFDHKNRL